MSSPATVTLEAAAGPQRAAMAVDRRGRTTVSGRALRSVAAAGVAVELGVPRGDVSVELHDERGLLAVVVRTPVVVDGTDGPDGTTGTDGVDGTAGDVLARAEAARIRVARDLTVLGGAGVGSCRLVVTRITLRGAGPAAGGRNLS